MGIDAKTLMFISLAIALIAGMALLAEGRATHERAQLIWGWGFLAVALGCAFTPLREGISFAIGVWGADGLLIVAHLFFLIGSARFVQKPMPLKAWAVLLFWLPLAVWPADAHRTFAFAVVNAALVGGLSLAAARTLLRYKTPTDWGAARLAPIFIAHGLFYSIKAGLAWVPGGFVDLVALKGLMIQLSLVEGIPAETLFLLVMVAAARRRQEAQLVFLAESDPLTGLLNRRAFDARTRVFLHECSVDPLVGGLMLCDLDHFKTVNDTCGHGFGDQILVSFASLLRASLPANAIVARYGGDEFVALLPHVDGETLSQLGATICGRFRASCTGIGPKALSVTVTIGTAKIVPGKQLEALLDDADAAAYEAKRRGRDQAITFDPWHLPHRDRATPEYHRAYA
jgi:diguanylate cyclase (GGDEF)-like protein